MDGPLKNSLWRCWRNVKKPFQSWRFSVKSSINWARGSSRRSGRRIVSTLYSWWDCRSVDKIFGWYFKMHWVWSFRGKKYSKDCTTNTCKSSMTSGNTTNRRIIATISMPIRPRWRAIYCRSSTNRPRKESNLNSSWTVWWPRTRGISMRRSWGYMNLSKSCWRQARRERRKKIWTCHISPRYRSWLELPVVNFTGESSK